MNGDISITRLTVRVIHGKGRLVGAADISLNDAIRITGLRIIERDNGQLYVDYPSRKTTNGRYLSIAYPVDESVRKGIEDVVIGEFEKTRAEDDAEGEDS